jgi:hypothetical protein
MKEAIPLEHMILKTHRLRFHLPDWRRIEEPDFSEWWTPYDKRAIMRYEHQIHTEIPEGEGMGRFPPKPWGEEVHVWIRTDEEIVALQREQVQPQQLGEWKGNPLGQAPDISQKAADLVGYVSPNNGMDPAHQPPPDLDAPAELQRLRGWTEQDRAVHGVISWIIRSGYPIQIGISCHAKTWLATKNTRSSFEKKEENCQSLHQPKNYMNG